MTTVEFIEAMTSLKATKCDSSRDDNVPDDHIGVKFFITFTTKTGLESKLYHITTYHSEDAVMSDKVAMIMKSKFESFNRLKQDVMVDIRKKKKDVHSIYSSIFPCNELFKLDFN